MQDLMVWKVAFEDNTFIVQVLASDIESAEKIVSRNKSFLGKIREIELTRRGPGIISVSRRC